MREILFRGKRKEDGKWIEGYLVRVNDKYFISDVDATFGMNGEILDCHCIDPETVGQYTGLNDKNGKKIFEGDVVHYFIRTYDESGLHEYKDDKYNHPKVGPVVFTDGCFLPLAYCVPEMVLVSGNIRDNPKLLEVE